MSNDNDTELKATLLTSLLAELPYTPLPSQMELAGMLCSFVADGSSRDVFLLKGYAGTGKTSLTAALVRALARHKRKTVLLAPTGRAAKVFSSFAGRSAYTIHKRIFRQDPGEFQTFSHTVAPNNDRDTIFIIDEASMIGGGDGQSSLLVQLLSHVYSGQGCRAILIGDTAQLPPVGQSVSPAMQEDVLQRLGLRPTSFELSEPVRQARESGILYNATRLRMMLAKGWNKLPTLKTEAFEDVEVLPSDYFLERIADSYSQVGIDSTLVVTRSNKLANKINLAIRNRVMYAEEELQRDERFVISKNNYFWTRSDRRMPFLANGELIASEWFTQPETRYGHRFADIDFRLPGNDELYSAKVMLDSLLSESPSVPGAEMTKLLNDIEADYEEYPLLSEDRASVMSRHMKILHTDPYLNALQVKYAYCLTCHKAQGGQWRHVYIDLSYLNPDMVITDFIRWLYTALTRASEKVFLINPSIPCQ